MCTATFPFAHVYIYRWHRNAYHRANPLLQENGAPGTAGDGLGGRGAGDGHSTSGEQGDLRFDDRYSLLSSAGVLGPRPSSGSEITVGSNDEAGAVNNRSTPHRLAASSSQRWRNAGAAGAERSPYRPPTDPRLRMERLRGKYKHVEISLKELHLEKTPFAVGGSGQCYKGLFGGTEIVAKVLFSQMICDDLDEFDIEVENLLKLRHPNVVR